MIVCIDGVLRGVKAALFVIGLPIFRIVVLAFVYKQILRNLFAIPHLFTIIILYPPSFHSPFSLFIILLILGMPIWLIVVSCLSRPLFPFIILADFRLIFG